MNFIHLIPPTFKRKYFIFFTQTLQYFSNFRCSFLVVPKCRIEFYDFSCNSEDLKLKILKFIVIKNTLIPRHINIRIDVSKYAVQKIRKNKVYLRKSLKVFKYIRTNKTHLMSSN